MNQSKKKEYIVHFLSIIFIVILCCINIRKLDYITVLSDEFGYWGTAAAMAGYNWKDLISVTPYYSIGYSFLLVPIISILSTPELWYKAAIFLNIFLLIGSYLLCCNIGKKLFHDVDYRVICFASLLTIIYPSNICYAEVAWSETLLYFLIWCITFCIIELDRKFSYKWLMCLVILFIYSYCVHVRNIGTILVGICIIFCLILKHKKSIKFFVIALLMLFGGYVLVSQIKEYQLAILWSNSTASQLNNMSVNQQTVAAYIYRLLYNLRLFIESLGGKAIYLCVGTGLLIGISILEFCADTIFNIKQRRIFQDYYITKLWCIFSIVAMWGMTSLQMINWLERKDMIVYSRYMEHALGPILFLSIMYIFNHSKFSMAGVVLSGGLVFIGLRSVYLRVVGGAITFNSICSPIFGAFYDNVDNPEKAFVYIGGLCCLCLIIFCMSIKIAGKKTVVVCGCTLLLIFSIIRVYSSTFVNDARVYFSSNTIPLRESILKTDERTLVYIRNKEVDEYCTNPKFLQFMIPNDTIHVLDIGYIYEIRDKETLVLVGVKDVESKEYFEKMENCELLNSTALLNLYIVN